MNSSQSEHLSSQPDAIELSVYTGGRRRFCVKIDRTVDVGRQRSAESPPFHYENHGPDARLIVADRLETQISRSHVEISPQADGEIMLRNTTRNCRITIDPGRELMPGKTCYVRGHVRLHLHNLTLVIQPQKVSERMISLGTPSPLTRANLQRPASGSGDGRTSLVATLGSSFDAEQGDQLMVWLRTIATLFYSASTNAHFLEDALYAIDSVIGLEQAMVWHRQDGTWHIRSWLSDGEIQSQLTDAAGQFGIAPAKVLERITEWKQTVLYHSETDTEEEIGIDEAGDSQYAIVASPIMDTQDRVVGALMGLRRSRNQHGERHELISKLEASLIELIASGVRFDLIAAEDAPDRPKTD
ncbi:hypothetical protein [Aporhodopirellula aestuarii]|uniref:FHA domain-containing protein n=1 Tax=Aporhodopirellula aestuarii TaxID=2950107 RepID=A0ABT0UBC4_9BACT|nr:hypothetical protein [Aporhodopirellula aestuarii]MCM2374314.1 hypothetical protein [Aporhodopirellula aestuarii]